jgi:hypothetical protein
MVLGFTDEDLEATLKGFPKVEGLTRPIFCVLTQNNINWPLRELVDDLLREREQFRRMKEQPKQNID